MWRVTEYDKCEYKPGDEVLIISKSAGRSLEESLKKLKYSIDMPQYVIDVCYKNGDYLYVIKGDYFLEKDLVPIHGKQLELFQKDQ